MLRIAICDDCRRDIDKIEQILMQIEDKWSCEFTISAYESGKALCEGIETSRFDVILLDILMEHLDGIQTAKELRKMGEKTKIVFISSYDKRIRELFRVGTCAFLDKPVTLEGLEDVLLELYRDFTSQKKSFFQYKINQQTYIAETSEIWYLESQKSNVLIHMQQEVIPYHGKLKDAWLSLQDNPDFIMPHRSYIVHLKYAKVRNTALVILPDRCEITIGRIYKDDTMCRYTSFTKRMLLL